MNKQEAREMARQADLNNVFKFIANNARAGSYSCNLITNKYIIGELNKLGFNCGLINEEKKHWHIDWSE